GRGQRSTVDAGDARVVPRARHAREGELEAGGDRLDHELLGPELPQQRGADAEAERVARGQDHATLVRPSSPEPGDQVVEVIRDGERLDAPWGGQRELPFPPRDEGCRGERLPGPGRERLRAAGVDPEDVDGAAHGGASASGQLARPRTSPSKSNR